MIQKLRRKFVLVFMGVVTAFLCVLLIALYLSSAAHYRQTSLATLHSAMLEGNRAQGTMPVIVVEVDPFGRMRVLVNQLPFVTVGEIATAVQEARDTGMEMGQLPQRNLRFLCRPFGPGGMRYAFADTYGEKASLRTQTISSVIAGSAAFLGFLIVSIVLSRWMVRPVEQAWMKQRQFVADASHELKTPLTVALSNVDMALGTAEMDQSKKNQRRLEIAKLELLRMKDLTQKLLTLARADANDELILCKPFAAVDLSYLLTCCAASFEPLFFDAGRQLDCQIAPDCNGVGDSEKLSELFHILLDNACKYSAPGSTVLVAMRREGGNSIHLTVENHGAAIPAESLPRIFDRFYRVDASRGETSGFGLGLSIANEIVTQHHGKIWASSDQGHTVFHVQLPPAARGS